MLNVDCTAEWIIASICVRIAIMKKSRLSHLFVAFLFAAPHVAADESDIDFNRDIRAILSTNCFACHGPDEKTREADLRIDTAAGAQADLGGYRAIDPENPDASALLARIDSDDPDTVMPPPDSGHTLNDQQKRLLRQWVAAGGHYDVHWSFTPPVKAPLPEVTMADWPRHAIDYFVLAKLEAAGLQPTSDADRYQWIRRVALDLTGLPPTPQQADAFVADNSADAFDKVVDRLLDSDAYGEHWARMWLDLARYADTKGYEKDRPRQMWRYRDWLIDALNRDMPFDQFTREQLAGDLLPQPTTDQLIATAFHRNTMVNDEGGTDNEEFRVAAVKDRVDTTLQVWMGLTMGCAKCHSHKYDPISQTDYYNFYALFNQTEDADHGNDSPTHPSPTKQQLEDIAACEAAIQYNREMLKGESAEFAEAYKNWHRRFETTPLWRTLTKAHFASKQGVVLEQKDDGTLIAGGNQPDKDTWELTLELPASGTLTALRIDVFPKSQADWKWPDRNVVIRELIAATIDGDAEPKTVKLMNPRADFSSEVGKSPKRLTGIPTLVGHFRRKWTNRMLPFLTSLRG